MCASLYLCVSMSMSVCLFLWRVSAVNMSVCISVTGAAAGAAAAAGGAAAVGSVLCMRVRVYIYWFIRFIRYVARSRSLTQRFICMSRAR